MFEIERITINSNDVLVTLKVPADRLKELCNLGPIELVTDKGTVKQDLFLGKIFNNLIECLKDFKKIIDLERRKHESMHKEGAEESSKE